MAQTEADLVTALTLTYPAEAIGIARAARTARVPVVISFTVETDETQPDGSPLGHAIAAVDDATDSYPAYFGIEFHQVPVTFWVSWMPVRNGLAGSR